MKRFCRVVLSLVTLFIMSNLVQAQQITTQQQEVTTVPKDTTNLFSVDVMVGTQSPWTKDVPLIIRFRSNITADNVEISWDAPSGTTIKRKHPQFISVTEGETYSYTANLKPSTSGTFNIAGNVTLWQYNTNYTSSSATTLTFGDNLLTQPLTAGYTGAVILQYLIVAILIVLLGIALYLGSKLGIKSLKEWLRPPE